TTGTNIVKDRIVEYSFVKIEVNGEKTINSKRINPETPIPLETSLIHGIYEEDIKEAPTFKQVAKNLEKFLEGCDLGGFNIVRFDVPMLVEEFLRVGVDFSLNNRRLVDAQKIFHLMEPRNLSAAYQFYCNKTLEDAHSAEADTIASYEVFVAQVERYEDVAIKGKDDKEYVPVKNDMQEIHKITADRMVDLAGRLTINAAGDEIFNFGKHKGKKVVDVFQKDPAYYDWFQRADFPLDSKRKLTEIKLRGFNQKK
ncbi:MAG: exonuclease domain-containing protein, partial [Bacteroidota bacterium]